MKQILLRIRRAADDRFEPKVSDAARRKDVFSFSGGQKT